MKSKASKCFSGLTLAIMSTTLIVVFIFCPSNEPRLPTIRSTHIVYESNSNLQAYGLDSTDISRSRQLGSVHQVRGKGNTEENSSALNEYQRTELTNHSDIVQHEEGTAAHSITGHSSVKLSQVSNSSQIHYKEENNKTIQKGLAEWRLRLTNKIYCHQIHKITTFLYHFRKSAGSSIRKFLKYASPLIFETEGKYLNIKIVNSNFILTILAIRHPIERIRSLYWYEHVEWFYKKVKDPSKVVSYRVWTEAWLDGSDWKKSFVAANPGNNYMEIDNYYVKALIGWNGDGQIGEAELGKAKEVLQKFDVVVITEWLTTGDQVRMLDALFQKKASIRNTIEVRGDRTLRESLVASYAHDEVEVEKMLAERNEYDIRLYFFAQDLARSRLKELHSIEQQRRGASPIRQCPRSMYYPKEFANDFGIFRPPKHKGPFLAS